MWKTPAKSKLIDKVKKLSDWYYADRRCTLMVGHEPWENYVKFVSPIWRRSRPTSWLWLRWRQFLWHQCCFDIGTWYVLQLSIAIDNVGENLSSVKALRKVFQVGAWGWRENFRLLVCSFSASTDPWWHPRYS